MKKTLNLFFVFLVAIFLFAFVLFLASRAWSFSPLDIFGNSTPTPVSKKFFVSKDPFYLSLRACVLSSIKANGTTDTATVILDVKKYFPTITKAFIGDKWPGVREYFFLFPDKGLMAVRVKDGDWK